MRIKKYRLTLSLLATDYQFILIIVFILDYLTYFNVLYAFYV